MADETTERMSAERARIITINSDEEILTNCGKVNQKNRINQRAIVYLVSIIPSGNGDRKKHQCNCSLQSQFFRFLALRKESRLDLSILLQFDEEFGKQVPKKRKIKILMAEFNPPRGLDRVRTTFFHVRIEITDVDWSSNSESNLTFQDQASCQKHSFHDSPGFHR